MSETIHKCRFCGVILTDVNSFKSRAKRRNWTCKKCSYKQNNAWRQKNPQKWNKIIYKSQKKIRSNVRKQVLTHYGGDPPKCACCEETELNFLSLDHINGGGKKHRKAIGSHFFEWIIKNNFPHGFEVLCFNCNYAKGFFGICPHKAKKINKSENNLVEAAELK